MARGWNSTQLVLPLRLYLYAFRIARKIGHGPNKFRGEIGRIRKEAHTVAADISTFSAEQRATNPLDRTRKTVFLTITCGQAVRNFLLSDVLALLAERYNVVILTPFAYSEEFRTAYAGPGVVVLPWFTSFRSATERLFQSTDAKERLEYAPGLACQFGDAGEDGDQTAGTLYEALRGAPHV